MADGSDRALMLQHRPAAAPGALSRIEAAHHVGVSATTFDSLVKAGEMPPGRRYRNCKRVVWLVRELDDALEALPVDGEIEASPYAGVEF